MSYPRSRQTQPIPTNQSFAHPQPITQSKPSKKTSFIHKKSRTPVFSRLKTDQKQSVKQPITIPAYSQSTYNNPGHSVSFSHHQPSSTQQQPSSTQQQPSTHNPSTSKISKNKTKVTVGQNKKNKKSKHTVSVINLCRKQQGRGKSTTTTKRKQSTAQYGQKIKQKTQDFKILAHCLQQYVNQQRRNQGEGNLTQIVKLISAFNRSEIAKLSKPLQQLIGQIIATIQYSLPRQQLPLPKIIQSPGRQPQPNSHQTSQQIISTVKKGLQNRQQVKKKSQLAGDVKKLQQNLGKLKYQSNRLQDFIQEITKNKKGMSRVGKETTKGSKAEAEKQQELLRLRREVLEQERVMRELSVESEETFRQESPL